MTTKPRWSRVAGMVALVAAVAWALVLANGGYNVAATSQHIAPVHALLDYASRRSIALRAALVEVPPLPPELAFGRGLALYREHCVQCHGAPGVAPAPFALGLVPVPANLALKARENAPAQVYWVIRYGLKMTAMPAWEFRLSEADLWAVTAFIGELARLSPDDYRRRTRALPPLASASALSANAADTHPDPKRGKLALQQYACITCHEIPGVVGASNPVGPSLAGIASRRYLAGTLPNTRKNMVAWLRAPANFKPPTAMPDLYLSERDAHDIAAFLGTLHE